MKDALGHGSDAKGAEGVKAKNTAAPLHPHFDQLAHDAELVTIMRKSFPHLSDDKIISRIQGDPRMRAALGARVELNRQQALAASIASFKAKYGGPRDHAAEARSFRSGQREINRLKAKGK